MMANASTLAVFCVAPVAILALGACNGAGDDRKSKVDELMSAAQVPSAKPPPAPRPTTEWKEMPEVTVDNLGAYIGGERADLSHKEGPAKLKDIVKRLPIDGKPVTVIAQQKAKIRDVSAVVWELGKAGAPSIIIKTPPRADLPPEISVVPEHKIDKAPGCSVAVMVNDKLDTGVWEIKGGVGRKHPKGFAGPDISNTEETLRKKVDMCDSNVAFFSGHHPYEWQHAFNLGALIKKVGQKKIEKIVLLADEPVAGREIKLRK